MNQSKPVIVYVGDATHSADFAADSGWVVFSAPTLRDALAQTIFSYPDAIVIEAEYDMLLAENSYYHLRTINHPPIVILSDMPLRWDMPKDSSVSVLAANTNIYDIMATLRDYFTLKMVVAS